eukprot:3451417-Rhodomonas_salina.3
MPEDVKKHMHELRPRSLDQQMLHVHMSMASTSLSSVLFTSRPITAALSKRQFQVWLLFLSLFWISSIRTCLSTLDEAKMSRRSWKFTVIELNHLAHHNQSDMQSSGVARIDLLSDNQVVPVQVQALGSSIMLNIEGETLPQVDGWCFTTRADHSRPDALKFMLLASNDGVEWEQVGSSSSFLDSFGKVKHLDGQFRISGERNQSVCIHFAKDHFYVRCILITAVIATALYFIGVGFAMAAHENKCRVIVGSAQMLAASTMSFVAFAGVTQVGFDAATDSDLVIAASCIFCFAYCFLIDQSAVLLCTTIASCIGMFMAVVDLICNHNVVTFVFAFTMNVGTFSFFKQITNNHDGHLKDSSALVKDDTFAYDAAWARVFQTFPDAVIKLESLVDSTWQSKVHDVHQYRPVPLIVTSPLGSPLATSLRRCWNLQPPFRRPSTENITARPASTCLLVSPPLAGQLLRPRSTEDHLVTADVVADVRLAAVQLGRLSLSLSRSSSIDDAALTSSLTRGLCAGRDSAQ